MQTDFVGVVLSSNSGALNVLNVIRTTATATTTNNSSSNNNNNNNNNLATSQRRPYCASVNSHSPVGSETPLTEPVYCVTVAFTNLLPFNGDFSFGKSQKSQGAKSGL